MNPETVKMIKRLTVIALFFVLLGFIIWSVNKRESALSEGISIDIKPIKGGRDLLSVGDVQSIIQRSFVYNLNEEKVPLNTLRVGDVEKVLEKEPLILDAEVYIDAQNQLYIQIQQREPIVRVIDKDNQTYYMDETGSWMRESDHSTARVLVATGDIPAYTPDFQKKSKKHFLNDLFKLVQKIRADDFLDPMIEQIYVKNKEFTLIPKVGNQKIILGKYEDIDDKIKRLKIFYREGLSREGYQKYATINLKYRKQVVCEKK